MLTFFGEAKKVSCRRATPGILVGIKWKLELAYKGTEMERKPKRIFCIARIAACHSERNSDLERLF